MRTTCIDRESGPCTTFGTARNESRQGPFSSGACIAATGGGPSGGGGGACARVEASVARKNVANANMHALFAQASASPRYPRRRAHRDGRHRRFGHLHEPVGGRPLRRKRAARDRRLGGGRRD